MLYLQNIKLESDEPLFNTKTKKIIRFSYGNKIIVSKFICGVVDQKTLTWDQVIKIPMVYEQEIDYQIINKHDFGYNPEEFSVVYNGKIFLRPNRTSGKWKVFQDTQQQKKKIGLLSLNYRRQDQQINYQQTKIPTMDESIPAQILVKNLAQVPLKAYIMLYTGKKKIKSPKIYPSQNGKGQFNFKVYFSKQFMKNSKYEGVFIEFFNQQNKFIGKSIFQFQGQAKILKARLLNSQSLRVGDSYLNLQQEEKKATYIEQNQQLMFKKFKTAQSQKNLKRGSLDLLVQQYNNTPLANSRISEQKRILLSSRVQKKNHSIIRSNKQIIMPISKRFEYHQDPNPSKVNYYSKLQTFDYFNNQSGKYYKGASIGKDKRFDFTKDKRHVPGVGSYKLPSQFDQF